MLILLPLAACERPAFEQPPRADTGPGAPPWQSPSPCGYPVVQVAAGEDVVLTWTQLDTDSSGAPMEVPEQLEVVVNALSIDAGAAEAVCREGFSSEDIAESLVLGVRNPGAGTPSLPSWLHPEGGATWLQILLGTRPGEVLLEAVPGHDESTVELTAEIWAGG